VCSALIQTKRKATGNRKLLLATVCMNAKLDTNTNLNKFKYYIDEASSKGAQLIVFPEIALQQNPGWGRSNHNPTQEELTYLYETAEAVPGPSTNKLVEVAKRNNIHIIFGMTEKGAEDKLYNSSVFLGPSGVIGKYRKRQLWDSNTDGNEHLSWHNGVDSGMIDSPLGKVGLMICIEMSFDFGVRLVKEGADFLVTVSAWPSFAGLIYEEVSKKNAVDTGCWHIVSNQVGSVGHAVNYGHSRIIAPNGEIIVDTGAEEGMIISTIDF
jgi:predicted amidohydrolase